MPLAENEIKVLAGFARFVDKDSIARNRVKNSHRLSEVVLIARFYGFAEITEEILLTATSLLYCKDWAWQRFGRKWSDQLFILSLLLLSNEGLINPVSGLDARQKGNNEKNCSPATEESMFYEYAKLTKDAQEELRRSTSI